MRALTNDRWGFESNCFVCEPTNEAGLGLAFFHDEDTDTVTTTFELDSRYSGAPAYVHGGLSLAILDEAMAWAAIAIAGTWAVTGETTTRFDQPVLVGDPYRVVATITEEPTASSSTLRAEAEILDRQGQRCAASTATFVVLGEARLAHASGLTGDQLAAVDSSPG